MSGGQLSADARQIALSFTRFGMVGVLTTALNYALFLAQLHFGVPYMRALIAGWAICVALGFVLNRRVTFNARGRAAPREILAYILSNVVQLALALPGFSLLIDGLSVPPAVAYPINLAVLAVLNFTILRFVVYPLRCRNDATAAAASHAAGPAIGVGTRH